MRRTAVLMLVLASVTVPGRAQGPGPRLHREIPGDRGLADIPADVLARPATPAALEHSASMTGWHPDARPDDAVLHPGEAWAPSVREMDRQTRSPMGARLEYHEVFTPSISPFKRQQAYDAVDDLGRLVVRDPGLRPVAVNAAPSWPQNAPAARFTGDVFVQLSEGAPTVVPSIAGQQRVVSYRTEPETPVGFLEDSAGNLYVRGARAMTVRLTYVLEAPEAAFVAPSLPTESITVRAPDTDAPSVPTLVSQAVEPVLHAMGVHRGEAYDRVIPRMVAYFRSFRDADLTAPATANLYADLALGKVGACRHRAYAFVLTLHALGVPARYVHNEAHAWAEVALPGTGWTRVDLGGWDINLHADAPTPRAVFVPTNPDPYPRPAQYSNGYSTLSNLRPGQRPANAAPSPEATDTEPPPTTPGDTTPGGAQGTGVPEPGQPTASGTGPGQGTGAVGASGGATQGAVSGPRGVARRGGTPGGRPGEVPGVDDGTDRGPAADDTDLARTALTLDPVTADDTATVPGTGFVRGSLVRCQGEARDDSNVPLANLPVEVVLDTRGSPTRALGTTVTGADGRYSARVLLPVDLPVGEYALRVRTRGDAHHAGSSSE